MTDVVHWVHAMTRESRGCGIRCHMTANSRRFQLMQQRAESSVVVSTSAVSSAEPSCRVKVEWS